MFMFYGESFQYPHKPQSPLLSNVPLSTSSVLDTLSIALFLLLPGGNTSLGVGAKVLLGSPAL